MHACKKILMYLVIHSDKGLVLGVLTTRKERNCSQHYTAKEKERITK